ncbi:MAG: hypothetical protein P1Q69_15750 [Candidatus Thorarchaeota archaeon]|nr:hypothetical protein [Candidatus Thorarchaeota archaeon]
MKLEASLVNSDTAVIVLDEYDDTCWLWVGRNVNMPTRMHALRMSKSVQKAGYNIGSTTIGRSLSHLVEMMEKDDSDADVATNIARFRDFVSRKWSFDDGVLAYDPKEATAYEAQPLEITDTRPEPTPTPELRKPVEVIAKTVPEEPKPVAAVGTASMIAEKKAAFLLYSAVMHADLVYTERFERDGNKGLKIEAPGIMVIEVLMKANDLVVEPAEFGDNEQAADIKRSYETWLKRI